MRIKLFSSRRMKNLFCKFLIVSYFFIAGLIFDLAKNIISLFSGNKTILPDESFQLYVLINVGIFLIALIFIVFIDNRNVLAPIMGIIFASVGFLNSTFVAVGIITTAWHFNLGAFAGLVFFLSSFFIGLRNTLYKVIITEENKILSLKDDAWSMFKLLIQLVVALGLLTGVCMTILFGPGYEDITIKLMAIQMVIGFGFCAGAIYFWGIYPSFNVISIIRSLGY